MAIKYLLQMLPFFVLAISWQTPSQAATIVKSLPGYPGELPFHLETGYIGVGEEEEVQLFYYFVESENDPKRDPLFLWLTGGPGCSAFSGLVLEVGPLIFNTTAASYLAEVPILELNPYSWTKVASVIFLDSPVGTGFSYATTQNGYYSDDLITSWQIYEFLQKWLEEHSQFRSSPIFVAGDSYSGKIVPIVVQNILTGKKDEFGQNLNIKGYIMGNPYTRDATPSKYEFAHRVSLLSDELYEAGERYRDVIHATAEETIRIDLSTPLESTKLSCNGNYKHVDPSNMECKKNLEIVTHFIDDIIFGAHVLEPKCNNVSHNQCREKDYVLIVMWANNIEVQNALNIKKGTKSQWVRCNKTLAYEHNVQSSVEYHQNITNELLDVLVYSGDQDYVVPYIDSLDWISKLRITNTQAWRPWLVNDLVAGYTMKFSNGRYHLTFATVKGAGHTAPEYKRPECLEMIRRWLQIHLL